MTHAYNVFIPHKDQKLRVYEVSVSREEEEMEGGRETGKGERQERERVRE